jgi:hypothetical protein
MLSPDGNHIAYFEENQRVPTRLMTIASDGGQPRELTAWASMPGRWMGRAAWTSDNRHLLCLVSGKPSASKTVRRAASCLFRSGGRFVLDPRRRSRRRSGSGALALQGVWPKRAPRGQVRAGASGDA